MTDQPEYSNLELIAQVDTWPYYQRDPSAYNEHMKDYYYFMIGGFAAPFGYVHATTISKVNWPKFWTVDETERKLIFDGGDDFTTRAQRMEETLRANPKTDEASAFSGWCDELFPIYTNERVHILDLDGAGVDAFGIVNFACHLNGYVKTDSGIKYWVPRRARTKVSFPGMLDNTVGGSLRSRESPLDCIVREAAEEAGLPEDIARANIKACGALTFYYVYEIALPEDTVPAPFDGEAESFTLMALDEVVSALRKGDFKLDCAMTWMAFLIRKGHVNAENEPHIIEICSRLHRKHDLFIV
ncbi:unnamed protein product [Periconia digitata]|uniref:Nudix hydrolase domain-containing protein n=1 Tax=Periconia digitata TaxID=1303443 RepID=A0A9W4XK29_9PLEO|nr:unnamed protein product [Periconia digitata]